MNKHFNYAARIVYISLLTTLFCAAISTAGETNDEIVVYQKFFEAIGTEAQHEQTLSILISSFRNGYKSGLQNAVEKSGADSEQKKKLMQLSEISMENFLQRMKAEIRNVTSYDDLVTNVLIPVYRERFTLEEIKELTSFYESPLGRKYVSSNPALIQETATAAGRKYTPQLQLISRDIGKQEFAELEKAIKEIKEKN